MINDESFDRNQFVLSYELLKLLEWLMDHEQESIKTLIKQAVDNGFSRQSGVHQAHENPEALQQNIIDFFALIDALLHETVHDDEAENALQRSLVPALNNIDAEMYDSGAYMSSVAKATAAAGQQKRTINPKDVLCKELLKRWKPHKKANMN